MKTVSAFWRVISKKWSVFWKEVVDDRRFWESRWFAARVANETRQLREAEKVKCSHTRPDGTTALVRFNDLSTCCGRSAVICQHCQLVSKDPRLVNLGTDTTCGFTERFQDPALKPLYEMPLADLRKLIEGGQQ